VASSSSNRSPSCAHTRGSARRRLGRARIRDRARSRFEADALDGIDQFSHAEILFFFDRVDPAKIVAGRAIRGTTANGRQ
jgi:tRNA (Thr-GGU) A37 N-methylase